MPWRANYGIIITFVGIELKKDKSALAEMKINLLDAEEILSHQKIQNIQDLNLGALAIFFETTLLFFVLLEINYEDYPAFKNHYKIIEQIPEFQEIDEKFHEFLLPLEKNERSPSIFTYFMEVLTTIKLGCYINGMVFPWMKILKTKRINEFTSCICFYSQYDRVSIYLD